MAITSTQAVAGFNALVTSRAVSVREPGSLTQKIPQLAVPSTTVRIGASASAPLLYDSDGLLRSLLQLDASDSLPPGTAPDSTESALREKLETVLSLNAASSNLGSANPGLSASALSAGSLQAFNNVLAANTGTGGTDTADQVLQALLAQALTSASSGLDSTGMAASALGSAGVLQAGSANDTNGALDSLPATTLALAATALDSGRQGGGGIAESGLPQSSLNDSSSLAFNRLLAADLEQAVAETETVRPRRRSIAFASASDLLLTGVSLLTAATDTATADVDAVPAAGELTLAPDISPESLLRAALRPLPRTPNAAVGTDAEAELQTEVELDSLNRGGSAPTADRSVTEATRNPTALAAESGARGVGAGTSPEAGATSIAGGITREPRYAEIAAAMNMSAAVYRYQASVRVDVPPGEVAPARTVQAIFTVPPTRPVR